MKRTLILSAILLLLLGNLRVSAQDGLTIINNLGCDVTVYMSVNGAMTCSDFTSTGISVAATSTVNIPHVTSLNDIHCTTPGAGVYTWTGSSCVTSTSSNWSSANIDVGGVVLSVAGYWGCVYTGSYPYNNTNSNNLSTCGTVTADWVYDISRNSFIVLHY